MAVSLHGCKVTCPRWEGCQRKARSNELLEAGQNWYDEVWHLRSYGGQLAIAKVALGGTKSVNGQYPDGISVIRSVE